MGHFLNWHRALDFGALIPYNIHIRKWQMTKLSPEAQAVLDAYETTWGQGYGSPLADAIRAVVEHCVPDDSEGHWVYIPHVLAIANEL